MPTGLIRYSVILFCASNALAQAEVQQAAPIHIRHEVGALHELKLQAGQNRLLILSEAIGRVAVADPTIADLKVIVPTQVLLTAKGVGTTDMTLWNKDDQPLVIALQVSRNLDTLRGQLGQLFPGQKIEVSAAGELVVLTGEVSDVRLPERVGEIAKLHAGKVANLVQVTGTQQVQIEVKFAEVSRGGLREMGVNFFHKARDGTDAGGVFGPRTLAGDFLNTTTNPAIPGTGPRGPVGRFGNQPPDVPAQAFGDAFSLFLSSFGEFPFAFTLSLLEANGLAKTLAEPTLVTLTGQEAKFLAGGELPIPVATGLGQVSVLWKEFGIALRFTPTVLDKDTIHLKLAAEVSDLDAKASISVNGFTIPGLTTRESETTVRLGDGQSFAIAGLLSDRVRSQIDQVPFLGSIPILGALFRSTDYQREETELLVVVTARLAGPVAPHELPPLPTERELNNVNDFALFLIGMDQGQSVVDAQAGDAAEGGPVGAVGFDR